MSDITGEELSTYLTGRLADSTVEVSDIKHHFEGWSRDTISFTASFQEGDDKKTEQLVVRAASETTAGPYKNTNNSLEAEYRVMDAMQSVEVPVPKTYWVETDASILGSEFFVMDYCPGSAPVTWRKDVRERLYAAWDSEEKQLPNQFVQAVAGIHSSDPEDVPSLESVPHSEVVDRELNQWTSIYKSVKIKDEPIINEAIRWLFANKPDVPETTVIHGDFRIGNMLIDENRITGVLDWELARIGDPLFDLGYASMNYYTGKLIDPIERPELACALVEREWMYDRYEVITGRTVERDRVRYWRAFSIFMVYTIFMSGTHDYKEEQSNDVRAVWWQFTLPGLLEDLLDIIQPDRTSVPS
jgi:aminoglycoside phosphotransferase (APT) family kinase protein